MNKPLYTMILYFDGSEHTSYATTDKEKARKVYWSYCLKYGYPPRVYVGAKRLRIFEADDLFKLKTHGEEHKKLFTRGGYKTANKSRYAYQSQAR